MNRGISKRQAEPEKCFLDKGIKILQSAKHRQIILTCTSTGELQCTLELKIKNKKRQEHPKAIATSY